MTPDKTVRDKLNGDFRDGIFLGVIWRTTEYLIGTAEGVFKCNTIKPRVAESAYDPGCIDYITVTYNDFVLAGAKSQGAKLRFADPDMPVTARMPATRAGPEFVPRRVYLKPDDFVKHGFTVSCPGCTWLQNGLGARRGHSEACRLIEKCLADGDDDKHRITINESTIGSDVAAGARIL